jgi:hypothetical protein
MSLHRTFSIVSKSITDSSALTTVTLQHSLSSQKCTSASLDCPGNTIQSGQLIRAPPPPKESPVQKRSPLLQTPPIPKPPETPPGEFIG